MRSKGDDLHILMDPQKEKQTIIINDDSRRDCCRFNGCDSFLFLGKITGRYLTLIYEKSIRPKRWQFT
jgi:hypothetical protein